jgi:pimeloyl-ACP methyl ester carboxylesterase
MPEISNDGVRIVYDVVGDGRPLMLLHGWSCDRSWWTHPGYVADLSRDHLLINVDLRGHGASDKPHDGAAYLGAAHTSDVLAVADAEGLDRFAIWGQSYGGWVAWTTAAAAPDRVPAIIASGAWDPRPGTDDGWRAFDQRYGAALRNGGTAALIALYREDDGDAHDTEFPTWARAVTLRADPEALLAAQTRKLVKEGLADLEHFPVPALLIAGEVEDEDDDAATIAAMIPNGQRLRIPGRGHGGACQASELAVPVARAFLDRWFPWPAPTASRVPQ